MNIMTQTSTHLEQNFRKKLSKKDLGILLYVLLEIYSEGVIVV
jgi:hypothetical protein